MNAAKDYVAFVKKNMADRAEQAREDGGRAQTLLLVLIIASLVIAIAAATWIALNISRGLGRAVGLADAVAGGDLTKTMKVTSNDEVGDLIACPQQHRGTASRRRHRHADRVAEHVVGQPGTFGQRRAAVAGRDRTGLGRRKRPPPRWSRWRPTSSRTPSNASQTEKIARQSARTPRPAASPSAARSRRCRPSPRRSPSCRKSPGRPICWRSTPRSKRRGRASTAGLRGGGLRSAQARRAQPDGGGRDRHAVRAKPSRSAREAGEMLSRLVPDIKKTAATGRGDHRRLPRAGRRLGADQPGDPAARQGDAAERQRLGAGVVDLGGTVVAGRAVAADDRLLPDRSATERAAALGRASIKAAAKQLRAKAAAMAKPARRRSDRRPPSRRASRQGRGRSRRLLRSRWSDGADETRRRVPTR